MFEPIRTITTTNEAKTITLHTSFNAEMQEDILNIVGYDIITFIYACMDAKMKHLECTNQIGVFEYAPVIDVVSGIVKS